MVCVAPKSSMVQTNTKWRQGADIDFVMADGVKRSPIGVAECFVFHINDKYFAVRCYVVDSANYQLPLRTEFLVATGAGLFPCWNRIIMTIPSKIEIEAYCRRITVEAGAPPLKEEDAEEYEEEEFELLNVAVSPATKIKAEYTPGVIRIGTQPTETIQIGMRDG